MQLYCQVSHTRNCTSTVLRCQVQLSHIHANHRTKKQKKQNYKKATANIGVNKSPVNKYVRNPTDIKGCSLITIKNCLSTCVKLPLTHTNYCPPDKSNYKNYSQQSNPTGLLQRPTITLFYSHRDPDPTPVILLTTERPWLDSADTGAGLVTIAWRTTSLACYTHPFSSPLRGTTRNIVQGKLLWTKAGEEQTGFRAEKNRKASVWIS